MARTVARTKFKLSTGYYPGLNFPGLKCPDPRPASHYLILFHDLPIKRPTINHCHDHDDHGDYNDDYNDNDNDNDYDKNLNPPPAIISIPPLPHPGLLLLPGALSDHHDHDNDDSDDDGNDDDNDDDDDGDDDFDHL